MPEVGVAPTVFLLHLTKAFVYSVPSLKIHIVMYSLLLISAALFAGCAAAKKCTNLTVPVDIQARQGTFNIPELQGNLDATSFAQKLTSNAGNFTNDALTGYQTVTGTYNISATFCSPDNNASDSAVQVLSHGIGYDKT